MNILASKTAAGKNTVFSLHSDTDLNEKRQWFSVTVLVSLVLFAILNIMPISFLWFAKPQDNKPNNTYNKLEHFVKNCAYESDQYGPWPWWVARAYFSTEAPDIVVMGDSQINAAFIQADSIALNQPRDCVNNRDCFALQKALQDLATNGKVNMHLVNLAMGGAMPSDYYLMSKAFFTKDHHPKLVVLSLSPRSFLDATLSSASATETFQFLSDYVDQGKLIDYAFSNPWEKYFWLAKNQLAVFKYRQEINLAFHTFLEQSFNSIKTISLNMLTEKVPADRLSSPPIYGGDSLVALGTNMVVPNPHVPFRGNKLEYEKRFARLQPQTLSAQSAYFLATLRYLKELGVKVIVVDMPMLEPVRELLPASFWNNYSAQLKRNCQTNNAYWLDLSNDPQFSQAEFLDYVHLNAYGGQKFVDRLAAFLFIHK